MRQTFVITLLAALLGSPWGETAAGAEPRPVTDERLREPEPENWLHYRRTYDGWGYSPLRQIDTTNVSKLTPVWTFSTGVDEGHQSPPIVNDGVLYVTTPGNQVLALEAATGELLWRYRRDLPGDVVTMHPTNRGVALFGDRVYLATVDCFLVALDASTGQVVWERAVEDYTHGYYMTLAPLAVRGKILVGVSGGEMGVRGFVAAYDAEGGDPVWKTFTVPGPGEPGHESWPGDSWKTGGASIWITGTYDPERDLTYWGTGNAAPWTGDARSGDNLYANSVVALDADTGELRGYHQYHWNDSWDWDEVDAPLLVDVRREGRTIPGLVHPGRNGYLWLLERRASGIVFVDAWPFVHQNVFTDLDPATGRPSYDEETKPAIGKRAVFCPSLWGGKNWTPAAYSPDTRLLYVPANDNLCMEMEGQEATYVPGRRFTGVRPRRGRGMYRREGTSHVGELQAWDLDTGEKVWTQSFESPNWGPVLVTAGGVVFAGGTNDRYFRAFDARSGRILWRLRTNSGVTGVPTTFAVGGTQYVAVQSGWGVDAQKMQASLDAIAGTRTDVPQGGVLWVFAAGE